MSALPTTRSGPQIGPLSQHWLLHPGCGNPIRILVGLVDLSWPLEIEGTLLNQDLPEPAVKPNRWEMRECGRKGHSTYRPEEPALADRLHADTQLGQAWRCLRCGDFVLGAPHGAGPAQDAPLVLRGKALRSSIILRLLALERLIRAILLGVAVWAVLRFRDAKDSIQATVDRDLPAFRAVGIHVDQLALVRYLQKALDEAPSRLSLIAALLAGYAALELIEGVGLWLLKRWGEYFAVVATSIFLPLEIRDLAEGVTFTRAATLLINLAAVLYLLLSKRLFGLRGGRKAYDAERRGQQLLGVEQSALQQNPTPPAHDSEVPPPAHQNAPRPVAAPTFDHTP